MKHGPLPVPKVQKIFSQLVGAVTYVHKQSCVHRDLKLENILFDKHENVKLVDFGFTREYEGRSSYLQTFCGTICYSAPEMLKGEKYAGEKVDVWSLGIILYALLCGELPFDDDDDGITRSKILSEEPKFPHHIPDDARSLINSLLSKRPFPRPSLLDILNHPFLMEHAPYQQAMLERQKAPPFTTALEKECLHRMKSAGVDIDSVIESVLAQRCDPLAGWWMLLIEKEERKQKRRERKKKEKETEKRVSRKLSGASSRIQTAIHEVEEAVAMSPQILRLRDPPPPRMRGRAQRKSGHFPDDFTIADLQRFTAIERKKGNVSPEFEIPPPPIDKDSVRSTSSSRQGKPPVPPPKGDLRSARSRGSTLHLVTTGEPVTIDTRSNAEDLPQKVKKKSSQTLLAHWRNWTTWLVESTKRGRNPRQRRNSHSPHLIDKKSGKLPKNASPGPQTSTKSPNFASSPTTQASNTTGLWPNSNALKAPIPFERGTINHGMWDTPSETQPKMVSSTSHKRQSLSPSPLTPLSGVRRGSGLLGRKSTSSSVSSIRSIHKHHHTHSKASSTSSNGSVSTAMSKSALHVGRSPHHSVKVLPATPTNNSFPSSFRLVRGPPLSIFNEGMPGVVANSSRSTPGSPNQFLGGGVMFAKRKRHLFKGPMLNSSSSRTDSGTHSRSASASGPRKRSGEITIQEEEEEYVTEEDSAHRMEEADHFGSVDTSLGNAMSKICEEGKPPALVRHMSKSNSASRDTFDERIRLERKRSENTIPIKAA